MSTESFSLVFPGVSAKMDCFCLRKKNVYDFSSPYTMSASGTYRTSVIEESSTKNGYVHNEEEKAEKQRDSVISDENHSHKEVSLNQHNNKNDLQSDLTKDSDKDNVSQKDTDKDLHDVNRNHESQNTEIAIDEVIEVKSTPNNEQGEGQERSEDNTSMGNVQMNGIHEDSGRMSFSEEIRDEGEGQSDVIQGHSEGHEINASPSSNNDHITYEEEQNVRNSSYNEDQQDIKVELDIERKPDHTPSYDVTAAAEDVPKDVVHMY